MFYLYVLSLKKLKPTGYYPMDSMIENVNETHLSCNTRKAPKLDATSERR